MAQAVQRGLLQLAGDGPVAAGIVDMLRIVDNYIKAYYISWGDELQRCSLGLLGCRLACVEVLPALPSDFVGW